MFTIQNRFDVISVARAFGPAALEHAVKFNTLGAEESALIRDCQKWASCNFLTVEEVNDGNREYSITAVFTGTKIGDEYFTGLADITIIRTGVGAFKESVSNAMENGHITKEQLSKIMGEIAARNAAAKWLFHSAQY